MPTNQIQDSGVGYVWKRCQHPIMLVLRRYNRNKRSFTKMLFFPKIIITATKKQTNIYLQKMQTKNEQ